MPTVPVRSVLPLLVFTASCSSTRLVSERVGPASVDVALRRVVVVGVSEETAQRQRFERAFAGALSKRSGVQATAATDLLGAERSLDRDALRAALGEGGFDAVLVIRKIGERVEVAERRTGGIPDVDLGAFDDFHGRYLRTIGSSSSDVATRMVRAEVTLLRTSDYREVWTGATDSRDPKAIDRTAADLAEVVVTQLRTHQIIG
jgi:hypothetical protein